MKYITYIYLASILFFVALSFYLSNRLYREKGNNELLTKQVNILSNKQLQYMESIRYAFDENISTLQADNKTVKIDSIVQNSRLALYIDNRNCINCWKEEVDRLEIICDSLHFTEFPIIICNNFTTRELNFIQKDTRFNVYSIGNRIDFIRPLTKFNLPFFCIIDKDKSISYPYFPSNEEAQENIYRYFEYAKQICTISEQKTNGKTNNSLYVLNDPLDLGEISIRKKVCTSFQIENKSKNVCHITSCMPSCSCIMIDSFSRIIPPECIGHVTFSVTKKDKGPFHHSINVQTSFKAQPLLLNFRGNCK